MSTERLTRLTGTALVLAGSAGTALTLAGHMDGTDGTLWFPVGVIIGIAVLIAHRPRATNRKGNTNVK